MPARTRLAFFLALAALAALVLRPRAARAQVVLAPVYLAPPGAAAPVAYAPPPYVLVAPPRAYLPARPRMRANVPLLVLGGTALGVGYVTGAVSGMFGGLVAGTCLLSGGDGACVPRPSPWLMVPAFGPILAMMDPGTRGGWEAFTLIDGALQIGGLAALIVGAVARHPEPGAAPRRAAAPTFALAPATPPGARGPVAGLEWRGAF